MNGAGSDPAPESAAGAQHYNDEETLAAAVRGLADHLSHLADLARMAAEGDPGRAARHLVDGCAELAPLLAALAMTAPVLLAVALLS